MSPNRTFYARREAADLFHRHPRTLVRWEGEGLLTALRDPTDPSGRRVLYAAAEVDNLLRRQRRLEDDEGGGGPEGGAAPPTRQVFRGWMFASSPGLNLFQHPIYDAWLIACKTATPAA